MLGLECTPAAPPAPFHKGRSRALRGSLSEGTCVVGVSSLPWRWLLQGGVCPSGQGISVPHLEGREQEVIRAARVVGIHHVPGQVDLGSQVLDSGEPPTVRGRRVSPGTGPREAGGAAGLGGWTPGPGPCSARMPTGPGWRPGTHFSLGLSVPVGTKILRKAATFTDGCSECVGRVAGERVGGRPGEGPAPQAAHRARDTT